LKKNLKEKMQKNEVSKLITDELNEAQRVLDHFINQPDTTEKIYQAASEFTQSILSGGKIFACGNGGSHCDAMHFAEELTGRYRENRAALPAIAISDPSHISCVSNDFGYDHVFSRYLEGLGREGDVLMGISTSGNSQNIINAVHVAKRLRMKTVLLLGKDGGRLKGMADHEIIVPHFGYADRIQEVHIKIIHIFILLIEQFSANQK
jgi:D-sedoheptulose 7-phosphate isomerase